MPGAVAPESLVRANAQTKAHEHRQVQPNTPAFPARCWTTYSVILCLQNLPECANGQFSQNRPSLELSPLRPKGDRA